jgi:hypothetical protein
VKILRLVDRLRGVYTVPVNDGAGLLDGKEIFTPPEPFPTPPIQKEAADRIEELERVTKRLLKLVGDMMPGVRHIALPDYQLLNDAQVEAEEALRE